MMKIFLSIKYHPDHSNRAQIEQVCAALAAHGHTTICIARDLEGWGENHYPPQELMRQTFEIIRHCDGILVDLNEKGVGVGIEAGYAAALGKPIWVIAQQGIDISETLQGIASQVLRYHQTQDLISILSNLPA